MIFSASGVLLVSSTERVFVVLSADEQCGENECDAMMVLILAGSHNFIYYDLYDRFLLLIAFRQITRRRPLSDRSLQTTLCLCAKNRVNNFRC